MATLSLVILLQNFKEQRRERQKTETKEKRENFHKSFVPERLRLIEYKTP